jgi:hypothetical protein
MIAAAAAVAPEPEPGSAALDSNMTDDVSETSISSSSSSSGVSDRAASPEAASLTSMQLLAVIMIAGSVVVAVAGLAVAYAYRRAIANRWEAGTKGFAPVSSNDTDCEMAGLRDGFGPSSGYDYDQDTAGYGRDDRGSSGGLKSSYSNGGSSSRERPYGHFNGGPDVGVGRGGPGDQTEARAWGSANGVGGLGVGPVSSTGSLNGLSRGGEVPVGEALVASALVRATEPSGEGTNRASAAAAVLGVRAGGGGGATTHRQTSLQSMVSIPLGRAGSERDGGWGFEDFVEPPPGQGGRQRTGGEEQDLTVYSKPGGAEDLI